MKRVFTFLSIVFFVSLIHDVANARNFLADNSKITDTKSVFHGSGIVQNRSTLSPVAGFRSAAERIKLDSVVQGDQYNCKYYYDSNGMNISKITYHKYNNETSKTEYSFDDQGNCSLEIKSVWGNNAWIIDEKTERFYDPQGHLIRELFYTSWGSLALKEKNEYKYENNLLKEKRSYDMQSDGITWDENDLEIYTYNQTGKKDSIINYGNKNQTGWDFIAKTKMYYDDKGRDSALIRSTWTNYNPIDQFSSRTLYTYDKSGNLNEEIQDRWYSSSSEWYHEYKSVYTCDTKYKWNEIVLPYDAYTDESLNLQSAITQVQFFDYDRSKNEWDYNSASNVYYSPQLTAAFENSSSSMIDVEPKLVSDVFQVRGITACTKVAIYDLSGNQKIVRYVNDREPINIDRLNNGIYLVKVSTGNNDVVKRIVKK